MTKVIILIGGPSKGTRFRPLSLERAKPLFPVAGIALVYLQDSDRFQGHPLIWHHLKACTNVPNLQEVMLMGFYTLDKDWTDFIDEAQKEFGFKIK
jgi:mannose-1-phosphate guanylyltransferase